MSGEESFRVFPDRHRLLSSVVNVGGGTLPGGVISGPIGPCQD